MNPMDAGLFPAVAYRRPREVTAEEEIALPDPAEDTVTVGERSSSWRWARVIIEAGSGV